MVSSIILLVILVALVFEFINGFHDTANAIATAVYTKALTPQRAIALAAAMNLTGALVSEKVAGTISKGLVDVPLEQYVILAALIGSLIGAVMVYTSTTEHIIWGGVVSKVIIPLFTSPVLGLFVGFLCMKLIYRIAARWTPHKVKKVFSKLQVVSSAFVAFSHGNNDAQKTMGIITLALVTGGILSKEDGVPLWVKLACAVVMAAGTSVGGWKVMKTMGSGVTKIEPASGFAAQTSSALVIELMTFLGAPVSTTQVITTSIMGTGTARRVSAVRWGVAGNIITAWIVTLPISMVLGGITAFVLGGILN